MLAQTLLGTRYVNHMLCVPLQRPSQLTVPTWKAQPGTLDGWRGSRTAFLMSVVVHVGPHVCEHPDPGGNAKLNVSDNHWKVSENDMFHITATYPKGNKFNTFDPK